jgi:lipoprotein-releasing system ATP-binding protein
MGIIYMDEMGENLITLISEDLKKSYQSNKSRKAGKLDVLKGISLEIESQKISIIVGASGAGKSTLLHILGGLDKPDSGNVFYGDQNIFKMSEDKLAKFRNKNIGFVFQFHHLLPEFTALENVLIPQMIGGISFDRAAEKSKELLAAVGLSDRVDHKPAELSGGEQQRVAIARALANDPSIVFADEPTGNLDSANSDEIHRLIASLRDEFKKTFVIVTHNQSLVELADKLYEIKDGKLFNIK